VPIFRWFVGGRELAAHGGHMTVEYDTEAREAAAFLRFVPRAEDHGKYLSCKATNEYFPDRPKEDGRILNVKCEFSRVSKENIAFILKIKQSLST